MTYRCRRGAQTCVIVNRCFFCLVTSTKYTQCYCTAIKKKKSSDQLQRTRVTRKMQRSVIYMTYTNLGGGRGSLKKKRGKTREKLIVHEKIIPFNRKERAAERKTTFSTQHLITYATQQQQRQQWLVTPARNNRRQASSNMNLLPYTTAVLCCDSVMT